jgi:hypothetical protein
MRFPGVRRWRSAGIGQAVPIGPLLAPFDPDFGLSIGSPSGRGQDTGLGSTGIDRSCLTNYRIWPYVRTISQKSVEFLGGTTPVINYPAD